MNCGKVRKMLSFYLDKEINDIDSKIVESHLKECAGCNEFFREMEKQDANLRKLSSLAIPEMNEEKVIAYWRAQTQRKKFDFWQYWRYIAVPALAAAVVLLVIKMSSVNQKFQYYPLNREQTLRLEHLTPGSQLKYRIDVVLADLKNRPDDISLDELREKIISEDFTMDVAKGKTDALKNRDYKIYDYYNKVEIVLLNILNENKPDYQLINLI